MTYKDKQNVVNILDMAMGPGQDLKENERLHHCPFCHHHKPKMNVNTNTQKWHCWVCDAKGKSIYFLLRKLNVDKPTLSKINKIYNSDYFISDTVVDKYEQLNLPKEFISLSTTPKGFLPSFKHAQKYLKDRGISKEDIVKHNIGFCNEGLYRGRIIVPSYDENNILNYFTARTIYDNENYKYKNPKVNRDIVPFGNQINWKLPIKIVEGVMDAISVKRNSIPILGKVIPKKLMNEIFNKEVQKIYVMLDRDAQKKALEYTTFFQNQGIECINIPPSDKDANQMGFKNVNKLFKEITETSFEDLVYQKLNC